jgi:hypothetical protein
VVKLVYCLRKRADISSEELYRYWLNQHGPLVRKFAQAIKARKYVQSHTVAPEINQMFRDSRGLAEPYDGITDQTRVFMTEEHTIFDLESKPSAE